MAEHKDAPQTVDYAAAEIYLAQAREADCAGDNHRAAAARRMVALALGLNGTDAPIIHRGHLAAS